MKKAIKFTYEATSGSLNPKHLKNCFQVFGYDFMLDATGRLWLLEVNCNPCLEESSELLRRLIPKLLTETMQIVQNEFRGGYFELL